MFLLWQASLRAERITSEYVSGGGGFLGAFIYEIHEGNTPADTHGCILVGENKVKGKVLNSRATLRMITDYIYKAEEMGEPVEVVVSS